MTQSATKAVVKRAKAKIEPPPMYEVIMLNDDYTPMEFVVVVLEAFFGFTSESAAKVMLDVHHKGRGVCGTFTKDIAETKVLQVVNYARQNEYPLLLEVKKV